MAAHTSHSTSYEGINAHKGSVMRTLFGRTECNRVVAIVLLLLVGAAFASAQSNVRTTKNDRSAGCTCGVQQLTSELTRDNLDRVAASRLN